MKTIIILFLLACLPASCSPVFAADKPVASKFNSPIVKKKPPVVDRMKIGGRLGRSIGTP